MGKITITVRTKGKSSTWIEDYDKPNITSQKDAEIWANDLVRKYNEEEEAYSKAGTLKSPHYRVLVDTVYSNE